MCFLYESAAWLGPRFAESMNDLDQLKSGCQETVCLHKNMDPSFSFGRFCYMDTIKWCQALSEIPMGQMGPLAMIIPQLVLWVGFPCIKDMCSFHVAFNKKHPLDRLMTICSYFPTLWSRILFGAFGGLCWLCLPKHMMSFLGLVRTIPFDGVSNGFLHSQTHSDIRDGIFTSIISYKQINQM